MDIWFIDEENTGSALLTELELSDFQRNRYCVFSREACVKKWAGHFPLHVQLFDAYHAGKNQADFYMISVLTQALLTEPDIKKNIVLLTKDKDLIQACADCCERFDVRLELLVSRDSSFLPTPEVASELKVVARLFKRTKLNKPMPCFSQPPKSAPKKQVRPTAEQSAKQVTKASDEKRKKMLKKVRKLLKQSPKTIQELVALLNVSQGDINRVTTPLVKSGAIARVSNGSKKWQLRQKGSH